MADLVTEPERWLPVVGWEGLYEVSDLGRVRSLDRLILTTSGRKGAHWRLYSGQVLKPHMVQGYPAVGLARSGSVSQQRVHRLVLTAFAGPCPRDMEGLHGPAGSRDAALSNLRWGAPAENAADKIRDGSMNFGERHGNSKLTDEAVNDCRLRAAAGENQSALAREYGVSQATMNRAITVGGTWRHAQALPVSPGVARGEGHGMARLTLADVSEIRRRYAAGELQRVIAADYGVRHQHISRIINRVRWSEPEPDNQAILSKNHAG